MVKIKELIKDSVFFQAEGFDNLKPEVSVFLPTFRRGDNGLLRQCIDSLLAQTFSNFELIIVDDASIDSTASIIKELMQKDSRISVIRHEKNIGLPAVSEYEAYLKSRADKIFFAFDDNLFDVDAIKILYKEMESSHAEVVYGKTKMRYNGKDVIIGDVFNYMKLCSYNYIPNHPLMLNKNVVKDIGFYDPHICMTRNCDWDLWVRIAAKYRLQFVDCLLSEEKGVSQDDSLGNSYPLHIGLCREWMAQYRDILLRPENMGEYEPDKVPVELSAYSKGKIRDLIYEKFSRFFWCQLIEYDGRDEPYLVVLCEHNDACVELVFSNLSEYLNKRIIVITYEAIKSLNLHDFIINATGIIFARYLNEYSNLLAKLCRENGIPYYYYTDDNLFELNLLQKSNANFSTIKNAEACLTTSKELIEFFKKNKIQKNFYLVNPCYSQRQFDCKISDLSHFNIKKLNFLYCSNHRFSGLSEFIPVLERLTSDYQISFYIFKRREDKKVLDAFVQKLDSMGCEVHLLPVEYHHNTFIEMIKKENINFILHPAAPGNALYSKNYKNKTLNMLLNAFLTKSFLLVSDDEPYSRLRGEKYVEDILYKKPEECFDKIKKIIDDETYRKLFFNAMDKFCCKCFSASNNETILSLILNESQKKNIFNKKLETQILKELKKCNIGDDYKIKYKLCGVTYFKIKNSERTTKYYLFGLPLFKIKKSIGIIKYQFLGLTLFIRKNK